MSAAACGMTCGTASVVRASLCRLVCLARVPAVLSDCILAPKTHNRDLNPKHDLYVR